MASKKSDAQFLAECKEFKNTRGIILIEGQTYQGTHHKYQWRCAYDGHIWEAPFVRILQNKGCPLCGAKRTGSKNMITEEDFIQRIVERNSIFTPKVTYVSGYAGSTKKCLFRCDSCGNAWSVAPKTIYRGVGCPACAKNHR